MRTVIIDNNITNSDWTKANAFDFPDVKTVEDFENSFNIPKEEPARSEKLARLAVLPWVRVAPAPVRELLEGFQKQSLVKLLKASFGGDRSEAGRYAANVRWQGHTKKDISQKVTIGFKSRGAEGGTVWATDKETGRVIGALSFDGYFISKVYVRPEHQRKGVASYLYKEAKKRNGGVEMRADDYTVSGAGFMSAMTGRDVFQSGDYSSAGRLWETWLNELEKETIEKASFGGDRSEAGRYAANVRWQNQKTLRVNDANSIAILGQSYNRAEQYSGRLKTDLLKRLSPEVIKKAYTAYMTISGEAESSEKTEQYFKDENKPITAWQDISLEEMVGRISGRVIGEYRGFQDDEGNTEQDRPMVRLLQVAVGEKFGLQQAGGNPSDKGYKQHYEAASKLAKNPDLMKVMETLVEVIYEESQKTLKEAGFTHIEVERGTKNDALATEIEQSGKATIMLRPVSSWSLDSSTAEMFAQPVDWQRRKSAGVIVKTMVPVEKVFSFGSFGFGRVQEDEVLLLGGDTEVTGRLNTKEPTPKFNPAQFKADFDARQAKMMAILNKTRDTKPIFVDDEEGDWIGTVRRMRSLLKASFGGDRSEAGRYAANIRWQGNRKGDEGGSPPEKPLKEQIEDVAAQLRGLSSFPETNVAGKSYSESYGQYFFYRKKGIIHDAIVYVAGQPVMEAEAQVNALGKRVLDEAGQKVVESGFCTQQELDDAIAYQSRPSEKDLKEGVAKSLLDRAMDKDPKVYPLVKDAVDEYERLKNEAKVAKGVLIKATKEYKRLTKEGGYSEEARQAYQVRVEMQRANVTAKYELTKAQQVLDARLSDLSFDDDTPLNSLRTEIQQAGSSSRSENHQRYLDIYREVGQEVKKTIGQYRPMAEKYPVTVDTSGAPEQ
jgi:GNAT superfamily N-acetyltransferase